MSWYKIIFKGDKINLGEAIYIFQKEFISIYERSGNPEGMFALSDIIPSKMENKFKLQTTIYLTPQCFPYINQLIADYSGTPCEQPDFNNCTFVVGDRESFKSDSLKN